MKIRDENMWNFLLIACILPQKQKAGLSGEIQEGVGEDSKNGKKEDVHVQH